MKLDPSDDQAAAMRMVGILVHKLGGSVEICPEDFEAIDGLALVMMDFDFDGPLKLQLVKQRRPSGDRHAGLVRPEGPRGPSGGRPDSGGSS